MRRLNLTSQAAGPAAPSSPANGAQPPGPMTQPWSYGRPLPSPAEPAEAMPVDTSRPPAPADKPPPPAPVPPAAPLPAELYLRVDHALAQLAGLRLPITTWLANEAGTEEEIAARLTAHYTDKWLEREPENAEAHALRAWLTPLASHAVRLRQYRLEREEAERRAKAEQQARERAEAERKQREAEDARFATREKEEAEYQAWKERREREAATSSAD